ncbi:MAG: hemerythrin domain-containing protein [Betaproteobacteria bacterium]
MNLHPTLGIAELDAQHEDIENSLIALQVAIRDTARNKEHWPIVYHVLENLHDKLARHFLVEESIMQICSYPELEEHSRFHHDTLESLRLYKKQSCSNSRAEAPVTLQVRSFYQKILNHDRAFARFVKGLDEQLASK